MTSQSTELFYEEYKDFLRKCVVLDVETTGINVFKYDLISFCLYPVGDIPPLEIFVKYEGGFKAWEAWPYNNFLRFKDIWEKEAVLPEEAFDKLMGWRASYFREESITIVGHNVAFDWAWMKKLAYISKVDDLYRIKHRLVDTYSFLFGLQMRGLIKPEDTTSSGAFDFFGIQVKDSERHTAFGDCKATKELIIKLLNCTNFTI